jgi:hypothetical protein
MSRRSVAVTEPTKGGGRERIGGVCLLILVGDTRRQIVVLKAEKPSCRYPSLRSGRAPITHLDSLQAVKRSF